MVKQYKPKKAMLPCSKGNKKVPAGVYALNIPLIKTKRETKLYTSNPPQPKQFKIQPRLDHTAVFKLLNAHEYT